MRVRRLGPPSADGHAGTAARGVGRLGGAELKEVTIAAGGSVAPHRHSHAHLVLVLAGAGVVESDGQTQRIGPDAVVLVPPDEPHAFAAAPGEALRFVCLDGAGEYPAGARASHRHDPSARGSAR